MSDVKPAYFSILTADVRYSKDLSDFEKLLFSEISALTQKDGFCSASNTWLGNLYGKSKETISRAISKLKLLGFINVVEVRNEKKEVILRKIYLLTKTSIPIDKNINTPIDENVAPLLTKTSIPIDKNINTPIDENVAPLLTKTSIPIDENVKENNTSSNNTSSNNTSSNNTRESVRTRAKNSKRESDLHLLAEIGVTGQIAEDHLAIRKAKRVPLTPTGAKRMAEDAVACGLTAAQAVEIAIDYGWASFRADWYRERQAHSGSLKPKSINKINSIPQHASGVQTTFKASEILGNTSGKGNMQCKP